MDKPLPQDPLTSQPKAGTVSFDTIPDKDPLRGESRITQQDLTPGSVKARNISNAVTSSHSGLGNGLAASITVPAAQSGNFVFTLKDNLNRTILAVPDVSVFPESVTAANQWPNSTYGMGTMPVTVMNDWGLSDNVGVVTRVVVRNNLTSDVFVTVVCRWRMVVNQTAGLDQSQAAPTIIGAIQTPLIGRGSGT